MKLALANKVSSFSNSCEQVLCKYINVMVRIKIL